MNSSISCLRLNSSLKKREVNLAISPTSLRNGVLILKGASTFILGCLSKIIRNLQKKDDVNQLRQ